MRQNSEHISSEDLLLFIDDELSERRRSQVKRHLEVCWECRARAMNVQDAIATFLDAHHRRFESVLPNADGPRALLRARLQAMRNDPTIQKWSFRSWTAAISIAAAVTVLFLVLSLRATNPAYPVRDEPIAMLTPGASVAATAEQVCSPDFEQRQRIDIPPRLRQRIFQLYGMRHVRYQDFELDFLITPELGGAASVQNLWPEPYAHTAWNAHIKDQLEVRLHSLVCSHELSLTAAQSEIASDWIGAYRKVFRTSRPLVHPQPVAVLFALLKPPILTRISAPPWDQLLLRGVQEYK